jgi:hypothetical protein
MVPNAESSLNEEAGRLLLVRRICFEKCNAPCDVLLLRPLQEAYDDYFARAKTWTSIHALRNEKREENDEKNVDEKKEKEFEQSELKEVEGENTLAELNSNSVHPARLLFTTDFSLRCDQDVKMKNSPSKPAVAVTSSKTKPSAAAPKRGVKRL